MEKKMKRTVVTKAATKPRESIENVKVFCRVTPLEGVDVASLVILSPTAVQLSKPEGLGRAGSAKENSYSFERVFSGSDSQKNVFDTVALPLVRNLMKGMSGLLFIYGAPGSGKVHTMNGEPHDGGILPRCFDIIFNSLSEHQAKKFLFKPNGLNGFTVQNKIEASADRARSRSRTPFKAMKKIFSSPGRTRTPDTAKVGINDDGITYAVYLTYVEIYNNHVYDLLENGSDERTRGSQSKILRTDANNNVYVHGAVELEVKTSQEALDIVSKGQRRKSWLSHSVLTIRVVQAVLGRNNEPPENPKESITVSQLSLVDLAGKAGNERTTRQRLKESGSISSSLMCLRTCIQTLCENKVQGSNKIIPFRDSKLTLLFKSFFEGEALIHFLVCINPRMEEEVALAMKFAQVIPEAEGIKSSTTKETSEDIIQIGDTPVQSERPRNDVPRPIDFETVYSLGSIPMINIGAGDSEPLNELMSSLKTRMERRLQLIHVSTEKERAFRSRLIDMERKTLSFHEEKRYIESALEQERKKGEELEKKILKQQNKNSFLQNQHAERIKLIKQLEEIFQEKNLLLIEGEAETERLKEEVEQKVMAEAERFREQLEQTLILEEERVKVQDQQLRMVKEYVDEHLSPSVRATESSPMSVATAGGSSEALSCHAAAAAAAASPVQDATPRRQVQGKTQKKLRFPEDMKLSLKSPKGHRLVKSPRGVWLDHRSGLAAPLGTVLQPVMKKRRAVNKLIEVSDVTEPKVSKYCLTTQENTPEGDLETRLYKADVVSTSTGGAQVIFNEMETLRQESPDATSRSNCICKVDQLLTGENSCCAI